MHPICSFSCSDLDYIRFQPHSPFKPAPIHFFIPSKTPAIPPMPITRITSASPEPFGPAESLAAQLGCDCDGDYECNRNHDSRGPWNSPVSPPDDIFDIPGISPIPTDDILDTPPDVAEACLFSQDDILDIFDVFDIPSPHLDGIDLSSVLGHGFDTTAYVAHGLYIAPLPRVRLFGDWDEFDGDVKDKLGVPSAIQLRYAMCYPEREIYFQDQHGCLRETINYNMGEYLLTDGPASCSLHLYNPSDAYINMLAAYPMNAGHGTAFVHKVKDLLRAAGITRIYLFVDNDADTRVDRFYTDKCGFTFVDPLTAYGIPSGVAGIWYEDRLYQAVL